MSVAAVMLVKDEADVIASTLRHLAWHVDAIYVADNGSTDGTRELLAELEHERELPLAVEDDEEVGHYQGRKMTALAGMASVLGHQWVIACDADEVWYAADGRFIRDYLAGLGPDVNRARALLFNHFPTSRDNERELDPLRRIVWRQRSYAPAQFGKVAFKPVPGFRVLEGNHSAYVPGPGVEAGGLELRHFSWRSEEQYVRKIANGYRAFAATDLPSDVGAHWRMHGSPEDVGFEERVRGVYRESFYCAGRPARRDLVEDPAPVRP